MPQTHAEYLKGRIEYYEVVFNKASAQKDAALKVNDFTLFHDYSYQIQKYEAIIKELTEALDHYNTSITPEQSPHESVCGC